MLFLRASWFYSQLLLANSQFLIWFFWRQYLKTPVVGVSLAWFLVAVLLGIQQWMIWESPRLNLDPKQENLAQNTVVDWRLATATQITQLCSRLKKAHDLQPTHKDILANLSFCQTLQNQPKSSADLWQTAQQLDPNAELFLSGSPKK